MDSSEITEKAWADAWELFQPTPAESAPFRRAKRRTGTEGLAAAMEKAVMRLIKEGKENGD